jgi:L-threonylcarbamoyladenylate synthase
MARPPDRRETLRLEATPGGISDAVSILRRGGLVAIPTETVYGLAAIATSPRAVAAIYAAKGRPVFNPLIVHLPDELAARHHGLFDAHALALAHRFWPGPLTLVVPVAEASPVCELARAGLPSMGLRVPSHPVALSVLRELGLPLAAPSANRSGHVSPTLAAHVLEDLDGLIDAVLDAGPCRVGVESSIVACLGDAPHLLRAGGITRAALEGAAGHGFVEEAIDQGRPIAPGLLASHYAPRAQVRLNAASPKPDEAYLAFGGAGQGRNWLDLSPSGNLAEAAANLYTCLRALDATGCSGIAVAPIPDTGLGEAINDRLRRAAS